MSDSLDALRRKIGGATELESVVRTMKALAAASIVQFERAVRSLDDYYRTVELGLAACVREEMRAGHTVYPGGAQRARRGVTGVVVFGSDQGLVGQFNEVLADYTREALAQMPGDKNVWVAGERMQAHLEMRALLVAGLFQVPNSIAAVTTLVGRVLIDIETQRESGRVDEIYLFHNRPRARASYAPAMQRLLPLDAAWREGLSRVPWPGHNLPEALAGSAETLRALVREYLFISLFRACAESLASEHASRLAAMQRAQKNIGELLEQLRLDYHRQRQDSIDEELFDVIAGFEALRAEKPSRSS